MNNNSYQKLKKLLTDFETTLKKSKLTTDELSDLIDRIGWLQEVSCDKECIDE